MFSRKVSEIRRIEDSIYSKSKIWSGFTSGELFIILKGLSAYKRELTKLEDFSRKFK